jgi:hypothetical protein
VRRVSKRSPAGDRGFRPVGLPLAALAALAALVLGGCGAEVTAESARPATAEKWYLRAEQNFKGADCDEARDSVGKALSIVPDDASVRTLAARVALARLDFAETLRVLKGVHSTEASSLRGRAYWYKGELEPAADELESMLNDPEVIDDWAKGVSKLARQGQGRVPFALSGGMLAAVDIVHVNPDAPFFIVPIEIDGESALAMIATANAEVILDSATRPEPSWVSLRFGQRLEVHDVPALPQDLSGISKQLGAPIKALLGVNLLRHLSATIDYDGRQFVVREFTPPPPPNATRLDLCYFRGGGMVIHSAFQGEKGPRASLLINTAMWYPVALDQGGWKKAGLDLATLTLVAQDPTQKLREGVVPMMRLGAFDVPRTPGVYDEAMMAELAKLKKTLDIDIDGIVGAGLLSRFRLTFGDGGRLLWVEDNTALQELLTAPPPPAAPASPGLPGGVVPGSMVLPPGGPAPGGAQLGPADAGDPGAPTKKTGDKPAKKRPAP